MNWLEQAIKAAILTVCLGVIYITVSDVMAKIQAAPVQTSIQ